MRWRMVPTTGAKWRFEPSSTLRPLREMPGTLVRTRARHAR